MGEVFVCGFLTRWSQSDFRTDSCVTFIDNHTNFNSVTYRKGPVPRVYLKIERIVSCIVLLLNLNRPNLVYRFGPLVVLFLRERGKKQ